LSNLIIKKETLSLRSGYKEKVVKVGVLTDLKAEDALTCGER
jgi:hypothetical protein